MMTDTGKHEKVPVAEIEKLIREIGGVLTSLKQPSGLVLAALLYHVRTMLKEWNDGKDEFEIVNEETALYAGISAMADALIVILIREMTVLPDHLKAQLEKNQHLSEVEVPFISVPPGKAH